MTTNIERAAEIIREDQAGGMTGKWTIKKYSRDSREYLPWPWLLFAPGITPPETVREAYEIEYPKRAMCSSQAQALKEIKTIKLLFGGDPR